MDDKDEDQDEYFELRQEKTPIEKLSEKMDQEDPSKKISSDKRTGR
jgi:hypothetical protein